MSAGLFYVVWVMYPVLFMLGPEGFGSLSPAASDIGYAITDLVKLAWGVGEDPHSSRPPPQQPAPFPLPMASCSSHPPHQQPLPSLRGLLLFPPSSPAPKIDLLMLLLRGESLAAIWWLNDLCRVLGEKYGTAEKQVWRPLPCLSVSDSRALATPCTAYVC